MEDVCLKEQTPLKDYYTVRRNGKTYAYRQKSHYWNKEKKRPETRLEYIGVIDENGNLIKKRHRLVNAEESAFDLSFAQAILSLAEGDRDREDVKNILALLPLARAMAVRENLAGEEISALNILILQDLLDESSFSEEQRTFLQEARGNEKLLSLISRASELL